MTHQWDEDVLSSQHSGLATKKRLESEIDEMGFQKMSKHKVPKAGSSPLNLSPLVLT